MMGNVCALLRSSMPAALPLLLLPMLPLVRPRLDAAQEVGHAEPAWRQPELRGVQLPCHERMAAACWGPETGLWKARLL